MEYPNAPIITAAQARKELARRAMPKHYKRRTNRPAAHIVGATGAELRAIVELHELAQAPVQVPAPAPSRPGFVAWVIPADAEWATDGALVRA